MQRGVGEMYFYKFFYRERSVPVWFNFVHEAEYTQETFQEMVDEAVAEAGNAPVAIGGIPYGSLRFSTINITGNS